jgi:hypothetical protein
MQSIASVTPTLCDLFGIPYPAVCAAQAFPLFSTGKTWPRVKRALVFAADAIGSGLVKSYEADFKPVFAHAPVCVDAHAVMPSVTPVCFASMFMWLMPWHLLVTTAHTLIRRLAAAHMDRICSMILRSICFGVLAYEV